MTLLCSPPSARNGAVAATGASCPAFPTRTPLPREARPEELPNPLWRDYVAMQERMLRSQSLASRRLVFLGDSLTAGWDAKVFVSHYLRRASVNLGMPGDLVQGALWRLPRIWGGLRPQLVVMMLGTNNLGTARPEDVALGIAEVVRWIHARSPETRILLVGILPRGADPGDPIRTAVERLNRLIARCADGQRVVFTDAGTRLLDRAGRLDQQVSHDRLHLTPAGYGILSAALEPEIRRLLGES